MDQSLFAADRSQMLEAVASLPSQLDQVAAQAGSLVTDLQTPSDGYRALLVCGMGGSGVGGDLVPATFDLRCPVVAVKGYDLPTWAGPDDGIVCVSYSGNTAETLSCYRQARERSSIAAVITSGGELAQLAAADGVPRLAVTSGYQPRAAVGLLYGTLAFVAEALGVVEGAAHVVAQARDASAAVVEAETSARGHALESLGERLARSLEGTIPVIYASGALAAVAQRWKAQINENGKLPAFANVYPELDHNEIVGWQRALETGGRWSMVELTSTLEDPAISARMAVTRDLVADETHVQHMLAAESSNRAGAVFELLTVGDYVSVYLALLQGVDPSPVERIVQLKERLATHA